MQRWGGWILCLLLTVSCADQNVTMGEDEAAAEQQKGVVFQEKFTSFQQLADRSLQWRTEAIGFYDYILDRDLYSNRDILMLHEQGTERYRGLREELLALVKGTEWVTDSNVQVIFSDQPTHIQEEKNEIGISLAEGERAEERRVVLLNPDDAKGQHYIKEAKISLAAALLLYDNYLLAISHYQELKKTRQLLNYDNRRYNQYLDMVTGSYLSLDNYQRTARALSLFARELQWEGQKATHLDEDNEYLNILIQGSYTYGRISRREGMELLPGNIELFARRLTDTLDNTSDSLSHLLTQTFSKVIGLVELRKGKLTTLDTQQIQAITESLQPLDILLEKTPFRLTDKTIPGYWGHAAIWVGGQKELEQFGIWDHPLVKPHQHGIRNENRRIVEALLPGVQINTLSHFLNIDDMAILRPVALTRQEQRQALLQAFAQLGKEYDYNFNVETDRRIVCSELAYVVFNDYAWETESILGRATISPDNIASFAVKTGKFQTALLYLDGEQVSENLAQRMKLLLEEE